MDDAQFASTLAMSRRAMDQQDFGRAITILDDLCRVRCDMPVEALLAECRYRAHADVTPRTQHADAWDNIPEDRFAAVAGVPEIAADALDVRALAAGIRRHGALLVRGLVSEQRASELVCGINQAVEARRAWHAGEGDSPWYTRLALTEGSWLAGVGAREFGELAGGIWAADSPRMLRILLELYQEAGLTDLLTEYFAERPMLSVGKTTLRRVGADIKQADWHQDGSFMGTDIRTVNVWLALSSCGENASGLDLLPQRLDRVLPTGTHGARLDWTVGPGLVDELAVSSGIATPHFEPGDALLFDHFLLHRTGVPTGISRDRYAVESWFFAPAAYPPDQAPLKI